MKTMKNFLLFALCFSFCLPAKAQFHYYFSSQPDSAFVYLNGEETCATPCKVKFRWRENIDGKMIFTLKAPGRETWSDTLTEKPYKLTLKEEAKLQYVRPDVKIDSVTPVIGYDKLLAKFDDGEQVGTYKDQDGIVEPLRWEGQYRVGTEDFAKKFYEVLNDMGFQTPYNDKIELFKNSENRVRLPRFMVGTRITKYNVRLENTKNSNSWGQLEIKGVTTMDLDWQVLDKKTGKIVLKYENTGISRYRQSRYNKSPSNLLAFEDAFYNFLDSSGFYDLVNSTEPGVSYRAESDSSENVYRTLEVIENPEFESTSDMIQYANPACVTIVTDGGFGSGVVVSPEGYVLSAYHVVDGVNKIEVKFSSGLSLDANIVAYDYQNDVVMLDITGSGFKSLPISDSDVRLGEEVITIGTPASVDLGQSIAKGLVSGNRLVDERVYLQLDMAVSPGNSGGPLLNEKGEVVGIVQSKIVDESVEGIGFALPMKRALKQLNLHLAKE